MKGSRQLPRSSPFPNRPRAATVATIRGLVGGNLQKMIMYYQGEWGGGVVAGMPHQKNRKLHISRNLLTALEKGSCGSNVVFAHNVVLNWLYCESKHLRYIMCVACR